jgi:CRP/FNR family transcriptional regulator
MVSPETIAKIQLFNGLSREHLEELAQIATEKAVKRGQLIFSEGDEAGGFYVVLSGRVKVFKLSPEGKEQTIQVFGEGESFGEASVFTGKRFPASAEAMTQCRLLFLPRDAFVQRIKMNPSLALNMLALLSQRLRKFANLVEALSLKEVPGRLAAYILYLYRQQHRKEVTFETSKSQLASLLGTVPETLSRILARMAKAGLIETDGRRKAKILDLEGLEELSEGHRRLPQ